MRATLLFLVLLSIVLLTVSTSSLSSPFVATEIMRESTTLPKKNHRWRHSTFSSGPSESKHHENKVDAEHASETLEISHVTKFVAECSMPTLFGHFRMRSYTYSSRIQSLEPIVMVSGDIQSEDVIVRVHDQCFTGEIFGSKRCDCREQLHESLKLIKKENGIVIYLQQEGRGIGVSNKVAAYSLQDDGMDTVDANLHLGFQEEMREYNAVVDILQDLNVNSIRLVTNNPFKLEQLQKLGVKINDRISLDVPPNPYNIRYLKSKRDRMNHMLSDTLHASNENEHSDDNNDKDNDSIHSNSSTPSTATSPSITISSSSCPNTSISEESLPISNITYAFGKQSVLDAIEAVKRGQIVLVVDDESRENEGDLIMAAQHATPATIGFIVRYSSGVLCVSMEQDRLDALELPPMVINNEDPKQTAYTVSVDCKHNTTTGISSADRATTFRALANPHSKASDFQRPGHVFPLKYRPGGVLVRGGHTEASMDLAKLAGLNPAAVLAEVVNDDGSIMLLDDLKVMSSKHNLVLTSVQDLIAYRVELLQSSTNTY